MVLSTNAAGTTLAMIRARVLTSAPIPVAAWDICSLSGWGGGRGEDGSFTRDRLRWWSIGSSEYLSKQWEMEVGMIVHVERLFFILVMSLDIKINCCSGIRRCCMKYIHHHVSIALQLSCSVWIDENNTCFPGAEHTDPFCFSMDRAFCWEMVFLHNCKPCCEILSFIIVILTLLHGSKEFCEVNKFFFKEDFLSDWTGEWIN